MISRQSWESHITLTVYEGGCIDAPNEATFTGKYEQNKFPSGKRGYGGTVTAKILTYTMWCDELH